MPLRAVRVLQDLRGCRTGGRTAAVVAKPKTSTKISIGIASPACAIAWPERCRGDDAENDADRDPQRHPAERRRDGGFEARPNAVGEQLEQGRADAARARQEQRVEQAEGGRRLPGCEQQHKGDQSHAPGGPRVHP
jgi:hypothetical protein